MLFILKFIVVFAIVLQLTTAFRQITKRNFHSQLLSKLSASSSSSSTTTTSANKTHNLDGKVINGDFTPVSNNVLVRVKQVMDVTDGGLFMPDNAKVKQTEGVVVSAGPGRIHPETALRMDMAVKVGENVMYGKYDGSEIIYDKINHQVSFYICFYINFDFIYNSCIF